MKLTYNSPEAIGVTILLDGQPMRFVLEADDVEGYILMHAFRRGKFVIRNDEYVMVRLEGDVRFEYATTS